MGGSLYEYSIASDRSEGLSWLWSYGSWIYNYLCNQCLSQPKGAKMCQIQYFSLNWLWRVLQVLLKETKWESHDHNCYYCLSDFLIWALSVTNGLLAMYIGIHVVDCNNIKILKVYWGLIVFSMYPLLHCNMRGCRGHDRMVVGFATTCTISVHHLWCEFKSRSGRGVQHYVIKFVSDLRQVNGFLPVLHQ